MAIKTKDGYLCGYCHKKFGNQIEADNCKESHQLIYLALSRDDLNRLVSFIYRKEDALLGDSVVERLQSYLNGNLIMDEPNKKVINYEEEMS